VRPRPLSEKALCFSKFPVGTKKYPRTREIEGGATQKKIKIRTLALFLAANLELPIWALDLIRSLRLNLI
jgi:hypothetical protein